jgi:hypothetical protein
MKYIIIAITLITTISLKAQDDHFSLTEGKVTWQKVYDVETPPAEIISYYKNSGLFKLFRVEDGQIIATLRPQPIDKSNKKIAGTLPPPLVVKTSFAGTIQIGFKDNQYRISYQEILLVGDGEMIKKGEKQPFEKHYVNKDGKDFRISFNKKPRTIYNLAFDDALKMKVAKSDDW